MASSPSRFVVHARWIIPVVPANICLEDHALLIDDGRIRDLLPSAEARGRYGELEAIELGHHILIPGLINAHGHAAMTLLRGYSDDRELMDWLENHIWPVEAKFVDREFAYDGTTLAIAEMIRTGTTCAVDTYWFPDATSQAYADNFFRAQVCLPVIQFPNAWATTEAEHLDKARDMHARLASSPLVKTAIAPHAPYTVTDEAFAGTKALSDELDIHLHETRGETGTAEAHDGKRPFQRIAEFGLLGPRLQTIHMTQLTADEIAELAATGTHVVHCPESNLKLASGFCPVKELITAGVNVCIGTDGAASNNNLDMLEEMRTAALLAKGVAYDPTTVDAFSALEMSTLHAARMLGMEDELGSLEIGKAADLTAVDVSDINFQPSQHPISQLVYTATGHQVSDVWVAGKQLLAGRRFTELNEVELRHRVQAWTEKMHLDGAPVAPANAERQR